MLFKGPLDKQFKNWGKHKQTLPAASAEMKERILQHIKIPVGSVATVKPYRLVWGALSGVLAVLVLFVGANLLKQKNLATINEQNMYLDCAGGEICSSDFAAENYEANSTAAPMAATSVSLKADAEASPSAKLALQDVGADRAINAMGTTANMVEGTEISVSDTREFLKYTYEANIKTRKVAEISNRLQTIVRGYGGRVDIISVWEKSGYITFVIPKASLEGFKNETKGLVNVRFFTENIQAQNLLPEKISKENSIDAITVGVESYVGELKMLTEQHSQSIASLEKKRNAVSANIYKLSREVTTSSIRQEQIKKEIAGLNSAKASWQRQINTEHEQYAASKSYLDERIAMAKSQLELSKHQDLALQEAVETVRGSIQINWVSRVDIFKAYVPFYWVLVVLVVCPIILLVNYFSRRRVVEIK